MRSTFWRVIENQTAQLSDFMSNDEKGIPPATPDPETVRLNGGVSIWGTETQARNKARQYPSLGTHLVAVVIDDQDATITVERTLLGSRGHRTAWGQAQVLFAAIAQGSEVAV